MEQRVGHYSIVIGVVIAIFLGIAGSWTQMQKADPWLVSLLVLAGLIVGFINITGKETREFLMVAAILAVVLFVSSETPGLGDVVYIGPYLASIIKYIMAFIVPAVIVVSLKDIYKLGQYS